MARLSLKVCKVDRTPICELYDNTRYRVRNIVEKLSINEITTLTFDLPLANSKWVNLKNENLILFNGEYYKIKKPSFYHDEDGKIYVNVECKHYSDNLAADLISVEETTPVNVVSLMKIALCYDTNGNPTKGWTVGKVTVDRVVKRGLEVMEQSPFSVLLTIAEKYGGILKFNSQTMTVDMLTAQDSSRPTLDLRVSKNLKSFEISYDTSEMFTRLYCYGATDDDGNELDIMSVNPTGKPYIDNFDYYKKLGYQESFIKAHPEIFVSTNIWRDDNYYDANDLYTDGKKELAKIAQPVVDVKVTALDTKTMGLSNEITKLELGSCIRVYEEDLGVDTLCNVTSREIDYENPHILNMEVTNSVVYHDTLSKLFTNVSTASSVVTSGGNIVAGVGGGVSMSQIITHLDLYYLNAEQIEAQYASINELRTNYLTSENIKATYIDAESIAAKYATIGQLNAIEAKIEELDVDYISGKLAEFEKLYTDMAELKKLIATEAEIEELKADNVTITGKLKSSIAEIENLKSVSVTTGEFEAYRATIEKLFALYATIEHLEANYITAKNIEATYAKIAELNAVSVIVETLKAQVINVEALIAKKASIEDLNAVKASIDTINAKLIKVDEVLAKAITTDTLNAELANIKTLITQEIQAVKAEITSLDTKFATIEQLNTQIANVETLIAKKATIEDLNAAIADIGELNAQVANISTILSGSIGTGILQTIHLTAKNVVIDEAVIKDLIASKISVADLKASVISTNKFQVQSDDGGFKVVGNTTQWTDATGKVRMQAGRDALGNFNFAVFSEDGTTTIFNEGGVQKGGIANDVIVDDMVAPNAGIQASKVNYINADGNQTLQTVVDVQQGKIDTLIKDTTIDGATLKDKYLQTVSTVDGMQTTIGDVKTDVEGINSKITEIKATADGVSTIVSANKGKWDEASSVASNAQTIAEQAANKFNWLVKSGTDETNFELTDRTATLVSNYINLKGLVTFSGLNSETQSKIEYSNGIIDSWVADAIVEGTTTINGGYIKTQTIKTDQLDVGEILATDGTFLGIINAQEINANRITSGEIRSDLLNVYGLSVVHVDTNIPTFSVDQVGEVTVRGSVESYDYVSGKLGWSIRSDGNAEFNDITVRGNLIGNYGGIMSLGGSGRNLWLNSSFENDLEGYTQYAESGTIEVVDGYNGSKAIQITRSDYTGTLRCYVMGVAPTITNYQAGDSLILSAWVYVESTLDSDNNDIMVRGDKGDMPIIRIPKETEVGKWIYLTSTYTAIADGTFLNTYVLLDKNGSIKVSRIKLERGEVATPWSASPDDKLKEVVFWAGADYNQRETAPYIVYSDGSVKSTQGEYSGVLTGSVSIGNIEISDKSSNSGGDALLTITDGSNGLKRVRLTDTDSSIFAQDVIITDNFDNTVLEMKQTGGVISTGGFVVKGTTSTTTILEDSISMGESKIYGFDSGIKFVAPSVNVGEVGNNTDLTVYGKATIDGALSLEEEVRFGDVIICDITPNGINFNLNTASFLTVQFNTDGGSLIDVQYVEKGGKATKPKDPTRSDAVFSGWYKDAQLTTVFNFDTEVVNSSIIIYAKWLKKPETPTVYIQLPTYSRYDQNTQTGTQANTGLVAVASTSDGGKLSYSWNMNHIQSGMGGGTETVLQKNIFSTNTTNTISAGELNKYIASPVTPRMYYVKGTCTVTNTLNGMTKSVTIDTGYV